MDCFAKFLHLDWVQVVVPLEWLGDFSWRTSSVGEENRQNFGGGAEKDFVEGFGVEGFLGADIDGADVVMASDVDEAGGGVDGA
jgi:hypothetical protein